MGQDIFITPLDPRSVFLLMFSLHSTRQQCMRKDLLPSNFIIIFGKEHNVLRIRPNTSGKRYLGTRTKMHKVLIEQPKRSVLVNFHPVDSVVCGTMFFTS